MKILLDALAIVALSSFSIAISCILIYLIGKLMEYVSENHQLIESWVNSLLAIIAIFVTCVLLGSLGVFAVAVLPFVLLGLFIMAIVSIITYLIVKLLRL